MEGRALDRAALPSPSLTKGVGNNRSDESGNTACSLARLNMIAKGKHIVFPSDISEGNFAFLLPFSIVDSSSVN
ncbi:hypothetical protein BRE01_15060 [Brevibacillus reuszeri]|uniref:Uncharacterized protein n=1 Tax=Brevibacillus reuszeri TaxID=54915 RepID=A0ABQ0TIW7_9BACL|nr:hypothetical protein BRE01_15060 [Brevibacillus reuszeri]